MRQRQEFIVNSHDTDFNGVARASAVLRYMQETAYVQHLFNPPSLDDYRRDEGKTFIISRLILRSYLPLRVYEKLDVAAWLAPSRGVTFTRYAQILRDGRLAAEMASSWAMIDIHTRSLLRVEDQKIGFEYDPPLDFDVPRIRLPRDLDLSAVGERVVRYSDCDLNYHMNNTYYPDMLCDFLPDMQGMAMKERRMTEMELSFVSEAPIGERLQILHGERDGAHYFRTLRADGKIGVEAIMRFGEAHRS